MTRLMAVVTRLSQSASSDLGDASATRERPVEDGAHRRG